MDAHQNAGPEQSWHELRDTGLGFAVTYVRELGGGGGHRVEQRFAAAFPERRRVEFLAGREALHRALDAVGLDRGPVLCDGPRPRLPVGVRASISHSQGVAVALAGPAEHFRTVGIDLELSGPPLAAAHLVLGPAESGLLDPAAPDATERLLALYSAKEAAFKALSPLVDGDALPGLRAIRLTAGPDGWHASPVARPDLAVQVTVRRTAGGVLSWALPT